MLEQLSQGPGSIPGRGRIFFIFFSLTSAPPLLFHSNFQSLQMRSLPTLDPYVFLIENWVKMRFFGFQTLLKQCQILYFSILFILLETLESPVQWVRIPFLNLLISHQFSFYCFNLVQLIHSKNLKKGSIFNKDNVDDMYQLPA